jgi:S1-C subfamily serine protease
VQIKLVSASSRVNLKECDLGWMINGQRLESPKARFAYDKELATLRIDVPRLLVSELGGAQQFGLRACKHRWSLNREQLSEVRHFVGLYEEDLAWAGPAAKGGTGGLVAPSGGWKEWKANASGMPAGQKGTKPLEGSELFKLLSPSVFKLEVSLTTGTSQGSAVAVTKDELLTNCHVVQGAQKIVLRQQTHEWTAALSRSYPAGDRCVLRVDGASFTPVRGVRSYAGLEVGESVFTLGSPSGLELTLSNGILSGLRTEEKLQLVQTTAPISPGSSGGGLFDAYGNLVGITTLVLVGRERMNQALNFAIPADSYWRE